MKINKLQVVSGCIIVLACVFLTGVLFNIEILSNYSRAVILPFFVYLYFLESETKSPYFATFLIACSVAELSKMFWNFDYVLFSKVSNLCYVVAYINLLIYITRSINFEILFKKFKTHITVLLVFNTYIIFTLNNMIAADSGIEVYTFNFLIECIYNVCVLLILSFSLLNYLYHDSKRGLLLFLASVCIVFSEMMQVAYLFVSAKYALNLAYSILLIAGFYLVYVYITSKINKYYDVLL
ncbi:hypothetical protein [uncultured Lacinutrix sp.]|uniref:hypothetical protein n=1 Tax=uncultured Lacinutrix sp. TaxID=574032 RepID=UPI002611506D|nr:hypothetical protein [uncultured Lacinutrix sp.]